MTCHDAEVDAAWWVDEQVEDALASGSEKVASSAPFSQLAEKIEKKINIFIFFYYFLPFCGLLLLTGVPSAGHAPAGGAASTR